MADLTQRVKAVAQALIAAAGMTHAVAATDIRSQAANLHENYAEYTKEQIISKIADEIKKSHQPGTSGSV